jgi:hypothetical protein
MCVVCARQDLFSVDGLIHDHAYHQLSTEEFGSQSKDRWFPASVDP